jgi:hypothetical protein
MRGTPIAVLWTVLWPAGFLFFVFAAAAAVAQQSAENSVSYLTGKKLESALQQRTSVTLKNEKLRTFLGDFSRNKKIAIFLDRRIDPGQELTIDFKQKTVYQLLYLIADKFDGGVCLIEDVIYIGPRDTAARLPFDFRNAKESLQKVENRVQRQKWLRRKEMSWDRLSSPVEIGKKIVADNELNSRNILALPHDLWPGGSLPPTTLTFRLLLLATGFGRHLLVEPDGVDYRFPPHQSLGNLKQTYPVDSPQKQIQVVKSMIKSAGVRTRGRAIEVNGPPAAHYRVRRYLAIRDGKSNSGGGEKVVSLKTESAIGSILDSIAKNLNVELAVADPNRDEIIARLSQKIKIDVEGLTYPQLIEKVLADTGLKFELTDSQLKILRK